MNSKIKKLIVIGIILVVVLIIGYFVLNHIRKSYDVEEVVEEKYFLLSSNGSFGIIDAKGNIVLEPEYYEIHIPNPSKPIFVCYYDYNQDMGSYRTKIVNEQGTELFTKYNKIETINLNGIQTTMPYEKTVLKYEKSGKIRLNRFKRKCCNKSYI